MKRGCKVCDFSQDILWWCFDKFRCESCIVSLSYHSVIILHLKLVESTCTSLHIPFIIIENLTNWVIELGGKKYISELWDLVLKWNKHWDYKTITLIQSHSGCSINSCNKHLDDRLTDYSNYEMSFECKGKFCIRNWTLTWHDLYMYRAYIYSLTNSWT